MLFKAPYATHCLRVAGVKNYSKNVFPIFFVTSPETLNQRMRYSLRGISSSRLCFSPEDFTQKQNIDIPTS